jgi:hypothetical protein
VTDAQTLRARRPRIELLYFAGCAHYEYARELVERAAADLGVEAQIELVEVPDVERAATLRFLGSPTVRIDGHDVEPGADERADFAFSCRLYRTGAGVSDLPEPSWIRDALTAART